MISSRVDLPGAGRTSCWGLGKADFHTSTQGPDMIPTQRLQATRTLGNFRLEQDDLNDIGSTRRYAMVRVRTRPAFNVHLPARTGSCETTRDEAGTRQAPIIRAPCLRLLLALRVTMGCNSRTWSSGATLSGEGLQADGSHPTPTTVLRIPYRYTIQATAPGIGRPMILRRHGAHRGIPEAGEPEVRGKCTYLYTRSRPRARDTLASALAGCRVEVRGRGAGSRGEEREARSRNTDKRSH